MQLFELIQLMRPIIPEVVHRQHKVLKMPQHPVQEEVVKLGYLEQLIRKAS